MANSPKELANEINSPFRLYQMNQKGQTPSKFFKDGMETSYRQVNLSPNDYFKLVASQSGVSVNDLIKDRQENANEISTNDIRKKMQEGVKFDTPWIRLMDAGEKGTVRPYWQEGLHRMLAAGQEYGMDRKFPIWLAYDNDRWEELDSMPIDDFIKYYDDTRLSRFKKRQEEDKKKHEERENYFKGLAAKEYGVLLEQVTPELLMQYYKKLDKDLGGW